MILDDALVERFSRQILLPEVGGRGQERLCAATIVVEGDDLAARVAATLLAAAGPRVVMHAGPPGRIAILTSDAIGVRTRHHATGGVVATLAGRPCLRCAPVPAAPTAARALDDDAAAQAIGSVAASEALCLLLGVATSRAQSIDLARGTFTGQALTGTKGCPVCGASR